MQEQLFEQRFFSWDGWDQHDSLVLSFYNVEFIRDFGKFNKGDKFESVCISYDKGIMEAYNDGCTEVIITQPFTLTPENIKEDGEK